MKTFKEYLNEMTIKVGNLSDENLKPTLEYINEHGKLVGHQDQKEIVIAKFNQLIIYGIKNDGKVTTYLACTEEKHFGKDYLVSNVIYTDEKYRNQKDAKRLYWFIKSQELKKIIGFGVQSRDGIRFSDSLAKDPRFETFWLNLETGEKSDYDLVDDSKYRKINKKTDWRIVVETVKEPPFPRYHDNSHPVAMLLNPYIIFE